ncbi:SDR family oxidoreductase [Microlunatus sp. GCM10028923]|uniref:SDR family oxidoreductase n=1 Tax=Microlunatus sp. GCM10028923 TaxID=3273400 RepID=UPI00361B1FB3
MSDRRYVVTGSASGIGAATATLLRDQGATVIGCDLDDADIVADLSTPAGRNSLVEQVARSGPIDAVLAVAGGGRTGLLETNYFGTVATLEGLRPMLARSAAPRAVAVSSTASLAPADERILQACADGDEATATALLADDPALHGSAYGIAKRALNGWVRRTAPTADWAGAGIPLNAVAPGVVDTPAAAWILTDETVRQAIASSAPQPLGFPGRPEWIGQLIGWLAGPENRFVTGQVIFADGGAEATLIGDRHWRAAG